MMKPDNHQERQQELEQAFQQTKSNSVTINENQGKIASQSHLVEMSGLLFDDNDTVDTTIEATTIIEPPQPQTQVTYSTASTQMPGDLASAQQEVLQAHQQLLNESQALQTELYQLHQAQEKVKQRQTEVQKAQAKVQSAQATANSIVNSLK